MVNTNNPVYSSVAGVLFDKTHATLIQYPVGNAAVSYTIPGSVTSIGDEAFYQCTNLTSIIIPNSVTNIGSSVFQSCGSLTSITIGTNLTSIKDYAFAGCYSLTSVTIPNSVTNIGNEAFLSCNSLTSITIGNNVTSIGAEAFADCYSLTSITIPNSVTSIGQLLFEDSAGLTSVYFLGNAPSFGGLPFYYSISPKGINATVYYLPGTTGWGTTYGGTPTAGGRPTVLWNPQAQNDAGFGVQNNQFGFNIIGSSNLVIVVEACTNLNSPIWFPVGTNTLNTFIGTNGTSYFCDPAWTNYPGRFYRLRSP
jgi:hypothetical protein